MSEVKLELIISPTARSQPMTEGGGQQSQRKPQRPAEGPEGDAHAAAPFYTAVTQVKAEIPSHEGK